MFAELMQVINAESDKSALYSQDLLNIYQRLGFQIINVRDHLKDWIEKQKWQECAEHIEDELETPGSLCKPNAIAQDLVDEFVRKTEEVIASCSGTTKVQLNQQCGIIKHCGVNMVVRKMSECLKKESELLYRINSPNDEVTESEKLGRSIKAFQSQVEALEWFLCHMKIAQEQYTFEMPRIHAFLEANREGDQANMVKGAAHKLRDAFLAKEQKFRESASNCHEAAKMIFNDLKLILKLYRTEAKLHHIRLLKVKPTSDEFESWFAEFGKQVWCLWNTLVCGNGLAQFYNSTTLLVEGVAIDALVTSGCCKSTKQLFDDLMQESFIVIKQPYPILRVQGAQRGSSVRPFTAAVRVLASEELIGDTQCEVKAFFQSESDYDQTKLPVGAELLKKNSDGIVLADFSTMKISQLPRPKKRRTPSQQEVFVYEHRYRLKFETTFVIGAHRFNLKTQSLPLLITTNACQDTDCWAALMWQCYGNDVYSEPYVFPDCLPWSTVGEMLSQKFKVEVGTGLDSDQLRFLGSRLSGKEENCVTDDLTVTWTQFNKVKSPLKFWEWFDGTLKLVIDYLQQPWNEGLILGFVNGKFINCLAQNDQVKDSTYLFRFSSSEKSTLNIDIVIKRHKSGKMKSCRYTASDFEKRNLGQVVNSAIVKNERLKYLYLDGELRPTDEVFAKYYTQRVVAKVKSESCPYVTYLDRSVQNVLDNYSELADADDEDDFFDYGSPDSTASYYSLNASTLSPAYMSDASCLSPCDLNGSSALSPGCHNDAHHYAASPDYDGNGSPKKLFLDPGPGFSCHSRSDETGNFPTIVRATGGSDGDISDAIRDPLDDSVGVILHDCNMADSVCSQLGDEQRVTISDDCYGTFHVNMEELVNLTI